MVSRSNLFSLKEWLTLPDTARHLSIVFGEDVNEADVLRLALDGHLKLSANFVNHAPVKRGKVIHFPEAELIPAIKAGNFPSELNWGTFPAELTKVAPGFSDDQRGKPVTYLRSLMLDSDRYLNLSSEITSIDGIWDLPMIGGERLDIEHKYQMMTGGPGVTLQTLDGSFVERADGEMCQLQESFDDNQFTAGSNAELENIKAKIATEGLNQIEAEKLLNQHKEDRKKYLQRRDKNRHNDYYPARGLPDDAVYVVRTEELREFERRISGTEDTERPLKTTERNTLLTVIAALCDYSAINHQDRGAATQLAKMTEEIGAPVTDDTIRKILSKIPEAIESRKK